MPRAIGVVASTGGPRGLRTLLYALPRPVPCAVAIVQHTAQAAVAPLAAWLSQTTGHRVAVAHEGQALGPGDIVVAPGDAHLTISAALYAHLLRSEPVAGHCPSGTVLLSALARGLRGAAAGVVLSGMGSDGAEGLAAIEEAGGAVFIEDPQTAVLSGMPSAARALTRTAIVEPAEALGTTLHRLLTRGER